MKTKVIIDRIEEGFAVIELDEDNTIDVPLKYLPLKFPPFFGQVIKL